MSWFGETFGDSLNSLKGQITKITKEVLADDEATCSEKQEPGNQLVKELEALCESKDLEITSLRDEFNKLHNQYKSQIEFLKNENKKERNKTTCVNDDLNIQKLQDEVVELRNERDHLNSCVDELQSEYQTNLNQVILVRDKYKSDLELLKKEFSHLKSKLDETLPKEVSRDSSNEIQILDSKIHKLQSQLEKEKEESIIAIKKEKECQSALTEELKKLQNDNEKLKKYKEDIEKSLIKIQENSRNLETTLLEKEKENEETEIKLKLTINEKEELLIKCRKQENAESELLSLIKSQQDMYQKLKDLLLILNTDAQETLKENNNIELINLVENKLIEKCREQNQNWEVLTNNLELEVKKLKEENKNFQNKLKILAESSAEIEKKYQEEVLFLKNSLSDIKTEEQERINQSQTDDVKKLEQEIAEYMSLIHVKNNEITDYSKSLSNLEQELDNLKFSSKRIEEELLTTKEEKLKLEEEIMNLKNFDLNVNKDNIELKNKIRNLELEKADLNHANSKLQSKVDELEKQMMNLMPANDKIQNLEEELNKHATAKSEVDKMLADLQKENFNLKNLLENFKAQMIIKDSNLVEMINANKNFQDEMNRLQAENNKLISSKEEMKKWKSASTDLQFLYENLSAKKEELENECLKLRSELESGLVAKDAEIQQLRLINSNLKKSCDELHKQLESGIQAEQFVDVKNNDLESKFQAQAQMILHLEKENSELKSKVQEFQEQMKLQMSKLQSQPVLKDDVQQHRRSKSDVNTESVDSLKAEDPMLLKQAVQQEQAKYQLLQHQFQEISNKEVSARREFERLKQHLIEVEDHYTEQAVENEKIINDLKSKLIIAEEQLHNSSTLYTSLKVRDNQHLESLQSQIRMVSAQRDDLQAKLSTAEDEIQKHKASLLSLQIVLEQFQQDKEREIEQVTMNYEKQLQQTNDRFKDLEVEIKCLKNQLAEAKNGLKAASRLGEQLEKKTQQVVELEENLKSANSRIGELENSLATADQASNGKIDKSLIKNLMLGYILSSNAERKSQVLKIMASVLDLDQDERNRIGMDASHSNWFSNILHPKTEGSPNTQSLSEAFIKFLENESRPQPQLKFLPEQLEAKPGTTPKPSSRLSELMLPTFNYSQENDSSIILKNVLKDS